MTESVILLVEDNANDELLTLRALRKHNIQNKVVVARDGAEALDYLFSRGVHANRQPADPPDLILLDLNLPKIGGLEVLRRIRADERTRHLQVVILTTSTERRDIADAYRLGANSFVRKPVSYAEFAEAVRVLGAYWLTINEPCPPAAGRR